MSVGVTLGRYGPFVNVGRSRRSKGRGKGRPAPLRVESPPSPGGSPLDVVARVLTASKNLPWAMRDEFLATRPEVVGDRITLAVDGRVRYVIISAGVVWRFERSSPQRICGVMYRGGRAVSAPEDRRGRPRTGEGGRW